MLNWLWIAGFCALATVVGYAIADIASDELQAGINGFAAGALIVMLVDSMIPEATEQAGRTTGLVTTLGFAVAAALSFTDLAAAGRARSRRPSPAPITIDSAITTISGVHQVPRIQLTLTSSRFSRGEPMPTRGEHEHGDLPLLHGLQPTCRLAGAGRRPSRRR